MSLRSRISEFFKDIKESYLKIKNGGWISGEMTATDAKNLAVYGNYDLTFEKAVNKEISNIELLINYKSVNRETVAIKSVSKIEQPMYQEVLNHFTSRGFKVIMRPFSELSEDYSYIIISWS